MKKLNTETFKQRMLNQFGPDLIITGEYVSAKVPITFKCGKCGHEGSSQPDSMYKKKNFCVKCLHVSMRKSPDVFLEELPDNIECLDTYVNSTTKLRYRCKVCNYEWSALSGNILAGHGCPLCANSIISKMEIDVRSALPEATHYNYRDLPNITEVDIYYEKERVAIELSGCWFHRETEKGKQYHQNKYLQAEKLGIRLIQVWDYEWENNNFIVLSRIYNALGLSKKVYARLCTPVILSSEVANKFLDETHIQGSVNASVRVGLEYCGELVAVMTFAKPRFNTDYDWELLRYSTKLGINVIGGASKLLKFSKVEGAIVSYCDLRYGNGNLYEKLGFDLVKLTEPNYFYKKGNKILSRYQCQKHKLSDILKEFDAAKSEHDNMLNNKYYRVYDAGNKVYELLI